MVIKIKDKYYRAIEEERPNRRHSRIASMLFMAAAMGSLLDSPYGSKKSRKDNLQGIDIIEEYKLILDKKSNLSANKRKAVENRFHSHFVEVKENEYLYTQENDKVYAMVGEGEMTPQLQSAIARIEKELGQSITLICPTRNNIKAMAQKEAKPIDMSLEMDEDGNII